MQIIYVLQAQGLGDNEYEFYNVGVYSSFSVAPVAPTACVQCCVNFDHCVFLCC